MSQIKAFIFDLEGVLILHKKRQAALIERAFAKNGVRLNIKVESVYSLRSDPKYHKAGAFIKKLFSLDNQKYEKELAENILQDYKKLRKTPNYLSNLQKVVPGAKKLLQKIKSKKIKIAIVSNSNPKQARFLLKKFGLRKYFDLIADDSCGLLEKPSPARIKYVIKEFGLKPADIVVVEDSVAGIIAAKKANVKTFGVLTGNATEKILKKAKAEGVFKSVKEIGAVVNNG